MFCQISTLGESCNLAFQFQCDLQCEQFSLGFGHIIDIGVILNHYYESIINILNKIRLTINLLRAQQFSVGTHCVYCVHQVSAFGQQCCSIFNIPVISRDPKQQAERETGMGNGNGEWAIPTCWIAVGFVPLDFVLAEFLRALGLKLVGRWAPNQPISPPKPLGTRPTQNPIVKIQQQSNK